MTIDDIFTPNSQTAADKLTKEVKTVAPQPVSPEWESYYKTNYDFYSYWRFTIDFPRTSENDYSYNHIDAFIRDGVTQKIENYLAHHCPTHSEHVRLSFDVSADKKHICVCFDFFADFFYDISGFLRFAAFLWRLRMYVTERYERILFKDRYYNPFSFGYMVPITKNSNTKIEMKYIWGFWDWGHILNALIWGDLDEMDTKDFREACRHVQFEVPGSALYDVFTVEKTSIWYNKNEAISSDASIKGFVKFYTDMFGSLSYAVLRSDEHQEPTPYITMRYLWRQINRNLIRNNKKPLTKQWLQNITGVYAND